MEPLGKKKCKILKDLRKKIAEENGIDYSPVECDHEGDCSGTCPCCDAELKYLQKEIDKKKRLGAKPLIAASVIGSIFTTSLLSSCYSCTLQGTTSEEYTDSLVEQTMENVAPPEIIEDTDSDISSLEEEQILQTETSNQQNEGENREQSDKKSTMHKPRHTLGALPPSHIREKDKESKPQSESNCETSTTD